MEKPQAFIFDIDNTLIKVPQFESADWKEYALRTSEAELIESIVEVAKTCNRQGIAVVVLTYRSEVIRKETSDLLTSMGIEVDTLYMRESGHKISSVDFKRGELSNISDKFTILNVFDDDAHVVTMLEEEGYCYTHVVYGSV